MVLTEPHMRMPSPIPIRLMMGTAVALPDCQVDQGFIATERPDNAADHRQWIKGWAVLKEVDDDSHNHDAVAHHELDVDA